METHTHKKKKIFPQSILSQAQNIKKNSTKRKNPFNNRVGNQNPIVSHRSNYHLKSISTFKLSDNYINTIVHENPIKAKKNCPEKFFRNQTFPLFYQLTLLC